MTWPEMMLEQCGYKVLTTLWDDFSIADLFGIAAIRDTCKSSLKFAKDAGYKELTELVLVLNHKSWFWNERNDEYTTVYISLYEQVQNYAFAHLKGEELKYFIQTTD